VLLRFFPVGCRSIRAAFTTWLRCSVGVSLSRNPHIHTYPHRLTANLFKKRNRSASIVASPSVAAVLRDIVLNPVAETRDYGFAPPPPPFFFSDTGMPTVLTFPCWDKGLPFGRMHLDSLPRLRLKDPLLSLVAATFSATPPLTTSIIIRHTKFVLVPYAAKNGGQVFRNATKFFQLMVSRRKVFHTKVFVKPWRRFRSDRRSV
jgi:hypothetical protein